jgi:NAD(P)H-hydrate epimerase
MPRKSDPTVKRVWALPALPERPADSHKGDYGRVLVVAGSPGMAGAAYLTSKGALRAGAGLVTCACPETIWPALSAKFTCVMTAPLPSRDGGLGEGALAPLRIRLAESDTLCIGPGLGRKPETAALVRALLGDVPLPTVVDADALAAVAGHLGALTPLKGLGVLTPHPGEMAALLSSTTAKVQADRRAAAQSFAGAHGVIVVLKGKGTVVTDGHRVAVADTGNPGMATAGTGDVLAGVIAGLLAQGMPPFEAAYLGVHLHGLAGDLAAKETGLHALIATDLLDALPAAFQRHARS